MPGAITASMLYDLVICEHRPALDRFGDQERRDPVNPFVKLLWERGALHEKDTIDKLNLPFVDLSQLDAREKEARTTEAMQRGEPLIYGGRIVADDLVGEPDLLRRGMTGYVAGDIKSGAGEEGEDEDAKLKKHYGVQLALYTDILEKKGVSGGRAPFVWDIHGEEVAYSLDEPQGVRNPWTVWDIYRSMLAKARDIVSRDVQTQPALSSNCKQCHWHSACSSDLERADDLTLLPGLGRSRRDAMKGDIPTVAELSEIDVSQFIEKKKTIFKGIGPDSLKKFQTRARLVKTGGKPILVNPVILPAVPRELFFDIETDPMRDRCYLHGFVERLNGDNTSEAYHAFFMDDLSQAAEERAFAAAFRFIKDRQPCSIYYYSKYERTYWRNLQKRYPSVCSEAEIEALFDPALAIDLYGDVVTKATEWPTRDYSIKTLAKYLGFRWRDTHPSGAASIEWFDHWARTGDNASRQRLLDYNEDDCRATRVLLDGIRALG